MAANTTHVEYDASAGAWSRARDVIAGEDAVKRARDRYLPRLESQTDEEYAAYVARASFFNATARTADGYVGLISRRAPLVRLPGSGSGVGKALAVFANDVDMQGTSLFGYAKRVLREVVVVGRAGTWLDWESDGEDRVYASLYQAENILNWRVERINGRNVPTMVALAEQAQVEEQESEAGGATEEQIRVLRLVRRPESAGGPPAETRGPRVVPMQCLVERWRRGKKTAQGEKAEWVLVETRTPLRRGLPLPLLPFVFQ